MTCHGGFSLDEKTRRSWYNPEAILQEAGVQPGMVFMDIGCGDGFFTLLAAEMVKENGIIYCIDVDPQAIERLKTKADKKGFTNIRVKVGSAEDNPFCTACADMIFYSMVLHDFKDPLQVLANDKKMLKPTGKLVNLDWKKKPMTFGPPDHIRFSEEHASELMQQAGFTIESIKDVGPYHYVIIAKP
jgi:ubiquinone/menaquinone biosynthesis C-methylase UbiE